MNAENERIEVMFADPPRVEDPKSLYAGFKQETVVLPKGYVHEEGRIPFPCDTVYERDVPVKLRDGVTIYADIYRPVTDEKLPLILSWGCSGKRGHNDIFRPDEVQSGISRKSFSGLQAWAGADPAHWVHLGYAVAIPDPRGTYMSEGDIAFFGSQDGHDCYDFIEWAAARDWCSGKVGMCGSAWYAMTQWNVASYNPPHLTCIAPWHANGHIFAREYCRGGIYKLNIGPKRTYGQNKIEDIGGMTEKYPLMNSYWEDKRIKVENINIPVYCSIALTGFTNANHMAGTFDCYRGAGTDKKWLRAHPRMNFADLYLEDSISELRKFFAFYLKGEQNGWEETPKIRICTFDTANNTARENIPLKEWPPKPDRVQKLYFDAASDDLKEAAPAEDARTLHSETDTLTYTYVFDKETTVTGYMKAHVVCSSDGANDLDIFIKAAKQDADGNELHFEVGNFSGPDGQIRVSRRHLDAEKSTELEPVLTLDRIESMAPGEKYAVEIGFHPTSMVFHPGEKLAVSICCKENGPMAMLSSVSRGDYKLYGGAGGSYILIPVTEEV